MIMEEQPHILVFPYPAQGHVMPLVKLSYCLVDRGCKITFVTTEFIHAMVINTLQEKRNEIDGIHLVRISDGLTPDERNNPDKIQMAFCDTIPTELEKLIRNLNENAKIRCLLADEMVGWTFDVARNTGIRHATFFTSSAGTKALILHSLKLVEIGAIDERGTPKINDTIIWSPTVPHIKEDILPWKCTRGLFSSEDVFLKMVKNNRGSKYADWVLCNTFDELEPEAVALIPNFLPIGPLLKRNRLGSFWSEDLTCLSWLDQQTSNSVIYVAFGSTAILDQRQIDELARGLELLSRPFLWVIRTGTDIYGRPAVTYPHGFKDRVSNFGKIVSWAPQQQVLSHPSIACFVSHCGWNSTIDAVAMGIPFICWPYFGDQLFNQTCITDIWKVGLGLNTGEDEIISGKQIMAKINQLLADRDIKENSQKLKELARKSVDKYGSSVKNLDLFVDKLRH